MYDETASPYLPFNIKVILEAITINSLIIPFIMTCVSITSPLVLLIFGTVYLTQ